MEPNFQIDLTEKDIRNLLQLLDRVETKGLQEAMILIKIANKLEIVMQQQIEE